MLLAQAAKRWGPLVALPYNWRLDGLTGDAKVAPGCALSAGRGGLHRCQEQELAVGATPRNSRRHAAGLAPVWPL